MAKTSSGRSKHGSEIVAKDAWGRLGIHTVQLWSGAWVRIRVPDLTLLLVGEAIPSGLERVVDARGVRLGVETIDRWELWRLTHGCAEECESCKELIDQLSTRVSLSDA